MNQNLASNYIETIACNESLLDDAAFKELFKEYFAPLCLYCQYKFDFKLDTAKEAVHSSFIKLWESRHTLTPDLSVKSYLYTIVTNICIDILRHERVKQKHIKLASQQASLFSSEDGFASSDLKQLSLDIDKAISELPEKMRQIFELSRYEGLKYAEISDQLNISTKTVETQISRALIKLREKLGHYLMVIGAVIIINL